MTGWGKLNERGAKTFPLHRGQTSVLASEARFTLAAAGTGSGKTVTGPLWIIRQIKRHIDKNTGEPILGMISAPTYQILSRATIPVFVETLRGTALEGNYSEARKRYYLPNGLGVIWTISADNPNGMEGGQYDFAWLDEGGQMSRAAWVAIQGRTGMKQAPVFITTTLYRLNWIKREIISRFRAGDPNYKVVSWPSIANPVYPREEYERARDRLPAALFGMRYDGVYPDDEQVVFSSFDEDANVRPCELDPGRPLLVGCNFESNPMAFVIAQRTGDVVEVVGELSVRDTTTPKMLDALWSRYASPTFRPQWRFYGDAFSRSTWRTNAALSDYQHILADARFGVGPQEVVAPDSSPGFVDRVAATNARFRGPLDRRPRLFVGEQCRGLVNDLETRFFEDDERKAKEPDDMDGAGPLSDALSFLVHALFPIYKRRGLDPVIVRRTARRRKRTGAVACLN